jgi:hypothetical protein
LTPGARTIARQPSAGPAGTAPGAPASGGAGANTDVIYDEVLRRLRQEQEQLGQLIPHPF